MSDNDVASRRYVHDPAAHTTQWVMRREQLNLEITNVAWVENDEDPDQPALTISLDQENPSIEDRLVSTDGEVHGEENIDITYRLQDSPNEEGASGVIAITVRTTGDYITEVNAPAGEMFSFITAARRFGERTNDGARYRVRIAFDATTLAEFEKKTLLVYSEHGELLRHHSLIPSGVEI